jgi:hypothetical protein
VGDLALLCKPGKNVNFPIYVIKRYAMKTYGGMEIWLHHSLLVHYLEVSGQLHASAALPPVFNGKRRLAGPQSWSGRYREEKSLFCRESNLGRPAISSSLY